MYVQHIYPHWCQRVNYNFEYKHDLNVCIYINRNEYCASAISVCDTGL